MQRKFALLEMLTRVQVLVKFLTDLSQDLIVLCACIVLPRLLGSGDKGR